jgi:hypothetical protein
MPKCVKCSGVFHSKFMVIPDERKPKDLKCVFCYLEKNVVTITDDKDMEVEVTRKDASDSYQIYLKKIVEKRDTSELVKPKSNIILPFGR